jgi:very-short-patch-repair endonuclease
MLTTKDKQKTLFQRLKKLRSNPTVAELQIKKILDHLKVKYIFQKGFISGNAYVIVDFYLPKPYKICIEVDGEYHSYGQQVQKDKWKDNYLKDRGFKVVRIKNCDASSLCSFSFL